VRSRAELEAEWTAREIAAMHYNLDALEDAEALARERARREAERQRR
jgi:hypothetical protein